MNRMIKFLSEGGRGADLFRSSTVLLLIVLTAYPAALLTWKIVERQKAALPLPADFFLRPDEKQDARRASGGLGAKTYPLFGEAREEKKAVAPEKAKEEIPVTSLNLKLKGIIGAVPMKLALAIIAEKNKQNADGIYTVGDTLPGNAKVEEIHFDRVILSRAGVLETLLLEEEEQNDTMAQTADRKSYALDKGVVGRGDGVHWSIDRQYMTKQLSDIPTLAKEVGLEVYKEGNIQKGYRLVSSRGSKMLDNLGLKPGDALLEVNGIKLIDAHRGLTAYQKIRDASEVRLTINRKGVTKNLIYSID